MRLRRGVLVVVIGALVATVAGCNLPSGKAGAKCSPVGKGAQDGTYVLTCAKNHRYKRIMTMAAGDALLTAYLLAHAHVTTVPPPPTIPPLGPKTTFGGGTEDNGVATWQIGTMPADIAAGTYTTNAGSAVCGWSRTDATGPRAGYNTFTGVDFMQILPTDNGLTTAGPCVWTLAPPTPVAIPSNGDATYRVGIEAPAGWYHFAGGPHCYWEVDSSLRGSAADVEESGVSTGSNLLDLTAGDASIQLRGCGPLTGRATPSRMLLLSGVGDDPILPSPSTPFPLLLGYDQTDTTIAATLNPGGTVLTVTGAGFTIVVSAPAGHTLLAPTDYTPLTMDVTGNSAAAGLSFGGNGHSCTSVGGTSYANLTQLAADPSGNVTALSLLFTQDCNGLPYGSVGLVEI